MKLSGRINSRGAILAGLAATEAYFLYRFLQRHDVEVFLFISTAIILLFATFYWIGWLMRRRVTNFHVCMIIGAGAAASICWHKGDRILSIGIAGAGIFFSMILLRRILLPIDMDQQEKNLRDYRKEANGLMPITRNALNLLFFLVLGIVLWAQDRFPIVPSACVLLILPLWYAGKLIYRFFYTDWTSDDEGSFVEGDNNQGGRA
jgi:hypothetical protein